MQPICDADGPSDPSGGNEKQEMRSTTSRNSLTYDSHTSTSLLEDDSSYARGSSRTMCISKIIHKALEDAGTLADPFNDILRDVARRGVSR